MIEPMPQTPLTESSPGQAADPGLPASPPPAPGKTTRANLLRRRRSAAETPAGDRDAPPGAARPQGCIFQVAVVVGVALILATLFTAWQPGQNPLAFVGSDPTPTVALLPVRTPLPPGQPTPTLRNPNLVGVVAGHWKNDSGAVCPDGLREVDLNLEIATRVQKLLADKGYNVELLSEFDSRLTNYEAAALVSIHNDSCQYVDEQASGFKVASAMGTLDKNLPARLTACLRARYGALTGLPLHSTSVTLDMTSYHAFGEISANTPAAIIETGFMNRDREFLTTKIDVVSEGVANGILCYLRNEVIAVPTIQATP